MHLLFWTISLFLMVACKSPSEPATTSHQSLTLTAPKDSTQYPFTVPLKDASNKTFTSFEVLPKGDKPTMVLFWLTTCGPCGRELKAIQQNFESWQKEVPFHLVALSEDYDENHQAFIDRVRKENWSFPAYRDVESRFKELMPGNLNGLPQTFIFDKEGNMTWKKRGFLPGDEAQYLEKIKEAAGS